MAVQQSPTEEEHQDEDMEGQGHDQGLDLDPEDEEVVVIPEAKAGPTTVDHEVVATAGLGAVHLALAHARGRRKRIRKIIEITLIEITDILFCGGMQTSWQGLRCCSFKRLLS